MSKLRSVLAALCCALCAAGAVAQTAGAQATSAPEIERQFRGGDQAGALQRLDQAIEAQPRDAQLRFLKGVLLAESGRGAEATEVYTRLTQEYPELPEPFNNLAVLQAAAGHLEEARDSLQTALRNDPTYATAHENLGDVYVRLAMREYNRSGNRSPELQRKLELARQLVSKPARGS
jgi:Flp pilus assembly protein TadD